MFVVCGEAHGLFFGDALEAALAVDFALDYCEPGFDAFAFCEELEGSRAH